MRKIKLGLFGKIFIAIVGGIALGWLLGHPWAPCAWGLTGVNAFSGVFGGGSAVGGNNSKGGGLNVNLTLEGTKFAEYTVRSATSGSGTGSDHTNITEVEPGYIQKFTSSDVASYAEPNDSGNNICIGWTSASMWDDVAENVNTIHGYVTRSAMKNNTTA